MSLRLRIFLTLAVVMLIPAVISLSVVFYLMEQVAVASDNSIQASQMIEPVLKQMRQAPNAKITRASQNQVLLDLYRILAQAPTSRKDLLLKTMSLFFLYLLLQFLIMVLTSAWLARSITRPLAGLLKGIQGATNRSTGFQISPLAGREFGHIGRTFNQLLAELDDQEARLKEQARLAGWHDVAAYLSHQLKNPLTSLTMAIANVRRVAPQLTFASAEPAAVLAESLSIMESEDQRILDLIRRFRASTTSPEPVLQTAAITDLLAGVQRRLSSYAITWHLDVDPGLHLLVDQQLIEEALVNLGINSVQAWEQRLEASAKSEADVDDPVTIRVRCRSDTTDPAWVMLEISDSIDQCPPELAQRVLREPFTTKPGGSGLGLMFVRVVAAQHGGSVACQMSPRGGLVFTLRLPSGGHRWLQSC